MDLWNVHHSDLRFVDCTWADLPEQSRCDVLQTASRLATHHQQGVAGEENPQLEDTAALHQVRTSYNNKRRSLLGKLLSPASSAKRKAQVKTAQATHVRERKTYYRACMCHS